MVGHLYIEVPGMAPNLSKWIDVISIEVENNSVDS